jgi:hypothetical protein
MWSTADTSSNEGGDWELKEDLVYRRIVLGRMSQLRDGIVEHNTDEEGQEYPSQWTDFPSGTHAASLGMPISCA